MWSVHSTIKPCLGESFYGAVSTAGLAYLTGHFAAIPIAVKFVSNMTICIADNYVKDTWETSRDKILTTKPVNPTLMKFNDSLLGFEFNKLKINRKAILRTLLDTSFDLIKYRITDWASDRFQRLAESVISQNFEQSLTSDETSFLSKQIKYNEQGLANTILGRSFTEKTMTYAPVFNRVVRPSLVANSLFRTALKRSPTQKIQPRSSSSWHTPRTGSAEDIIRFLYSYRGSFIDGYRIVARGANASYSYADQIVNRLNGAVVRINKRYRPHRIFVLNGTWERFQNLAMRRI